MVSAEAVNQDTPSKAVGSIEESFGTTGDRNTGRLCRAMTDPRDGQVYKVAKIGDQLWMAENLNYEAEGSRRRNMSRSGECKTRGRYYTWATAMDIGGKFTPNAKGCNEIESCHPTYPVRGVCPADWHLPTAEEWRTLIHEVGQSQSSYALRANYGWAPGFNGYNKFWFTALPEGVFYRGGVWDHGIEARFWASSEDKDQYGQSLVIAEEKAEAVFEGILKDETSKLTVRCVHD